MSTDGAEEGTNRERTVPMTSRRYSRETDLGDHLREVSSCLNIFQKFVKAQNRIFGSS
ncbi:unnamed protein product, partial [Nesidiocoris tenuis]